MKRHLFFCLALFSFSLCAEEIDLTLTNHTISLESGPFFYTAVTGTFPTFEEGEKIADLFFIAYFKNLEKERPITFVFPGGPGGAGTIESILTFGPRRLLTAGEGRSPLPPYKLIDNPQTLLEHTDLVFVDPVNCGMSKAEEEIHLDWVYSVEGDLQILSDFVCTFLEKMERWDCPLYLAGGSYGTLRCCGLALDLLQKGILTKGVILDGCAFEFSTQLSLRDQTLADCLIIPTFAATAWYHGKFWPEKSLEEIVDYARRFALDEYAPCMMQPSRLSYVEKMAFEKRYAELIGLPIETVRRYNNRIDESIYTAEFFAPERKALGGTDTRYQGDISTINPDHSHDPSYLDSLGYVPAFRNYLQKELNTYPSFSKYIPFSYEAIALWNFDTFDSPGLPNFLQRLRHALIINPRMSVFVGSGYFDCRTPFAATEYCFDHLELPDSYKKNLQFEYYEAGHGFIFDDSSLKKWKQDLVKWLSKLE